MLPSSLPLPHLWNVLLPLPAPDKISRFRVRFRFHILVCTSCDWLSTRFHKLQVTLLGLLGSATCQHVQQPQQKEGAYHKHIAATAGHSKTSNSDAMAVLVVYHIYHTHDLSQRRCAHGSLLIMII